VFDHPATAADARRQAVQWLDAKSLAASILALAQHA